MGDFFGQLTRLYTSAIGFLAVLIFALAIVASLARYVTSLVIVVAAIAVLRIVWSRTRW